MHGSVCSHFDVESLRYIVRSHFLFGRGEKFDTVFDQKSCLEETSYSGSCAYEVGGKLHHEVGKMDHSWMKESTRRLLGDKSRMLSMFI